MFRQIQKYGSEQNYKISHFLEKFPDLSDIFQSNFEAHREVLQHFYRNAGQYQLNSENQA